MCTCGTRCDRNELKGATFGRGGGQNVAGSARVNLWQVQERFEGVSLLLIRELSYHNLQGEEFERGTHAWKCRGARRESRGICLVAGPENETKTRLVTVRLARDRNAARVCV